MEGDNGVEPDSLEPVGDVGELLDMETNPVLAGPVAVTDDEMTEGCSVGDKEGSDSNSTERNAIDCDTEVIDLRPPELTDSDESTDADEAAATLFKKRKHSATRNYRTGRGADGDGEGEEVAGPSNITVEGPDPESKEGPGISFGADAEAKASSEDEHEVQPRGRVKARRIVRAADLDSDDDSDEDLNMNAEYEDNDSSSTDEEEVTAAGRDADLAEQTKNVVFKTASISKFNILHDLASRQFGIKMTPSFIGRRCGSVDLTRRLRLAYKLSGHEGCVNSLHFNQAGTRIASGSDDLSIIVWDWEHRRKVTSFPTGHRANVFQSKFLPGDLLITSCSRDGQVRLAELSTTGALRSTRKLARHNGPAHKMALVPGSQHLLLSAGEDGQVLQVDTREQKPDKILLLRNEKDKKIPIYSIHSNPSNGAQFCTAGRDQFIRIFDRRYVTREGGGLLSRFCPERLNNNEDFKAYITCAVFSRDGSEVIGSYNDEDIYLFRAQEGSETPHLRQYRGHRNSATVKGVNFYGPHSEFVVSGSDCGNVFIWDKETEAIVRLTAGDDNGVVNVLEPHPSLPVLATSGLDDEVKVWLPTEPASDRPGHKLGEQQDYMLKTVQRNLWDCWMETNIYNLAILGI